MLHKQRQAENFSRHLLALESALTSFQEQTNWESLHKARVAIKKIRAEFALYDAVQKHQRFKKIYHLFFHNLFLQAGHLRAEVVMLDLAKGFRLTAPDWQQEKQEKMKRDASLFLQSIPGYRHLLGTVYEQVDYLLTDIPKKELRAWYGRQIKKLGKVLSEPAPKPARLHGCRKRTKRILYVVAGLPSGDRNHFKPSLRYLKKLETAIGQWHDAFLLAAAALPEKDKLFLKKVTAKRFRLALEAGKKFREKADIR